MRQSAIQDEEVARLIRDNQGKKIRIRGESATALVLHVDDEGFTANLLDAPDFTASEHLWCAFEYISDVDPVAE